MSHRLATRQQPHQALHHQSLVPLHLNVLYGHRNNMDIASNIYAWLDSQSFSSSGC